MGQLRFGKEEAIRCIADVALKGEHGEELCIAYKTSTYWVGAGVYVRDDGYVARARGGGSSTTYYSLTKEEIAAHQSAGLLPTPLPAYRLPVADYMLGYSLWLVLVFSIAWAVLAGWLKARRRARYAAAVAGSPVDFGPPDLHTEMDRFVATHAASQLGADERVHHQAYAVDRDMSSAGMLGAMAAKAYYAVVTSHRVLLFGTRVGAFGPLRECLGVESIPRSQIAMVSVDEEVITLSLATGEERVLFVKSTRALSNQTRFLHQVPRLLRGEAAPFAPPPAPPAPPARPEPFRNRRA
jgi:hypothetical protein